MLNSKPTRSAALWLQLYNALALLIAPVTLLKKALKFRRFGHAYEWDRERWSIPFSLRGEEKSGLRVALVALGWAEVVVIDKISRRLERERPDLTIVWVLRDVEARRMAREAFPEREIVAMPFDFLVPLRQFLRKVRPDALIVVEKFWWPNLVWGSKLSGAQVILVNGRSRGREKSRYKLLGGFQKWILSAFDLLLFESESQLERVRDVLPAGARAEATGNLKWSFEVPPPPPQSESLEKWIQERQSDGNGALPLFFAGSTAPADETWALEAWQQVKSQFPCVLLLAPRRPNRAAEIAMRLQEEGFETSLRSAPRPHCEILILDTMGELSYAYRFATAAYVGGAIEGRGHNIIEPLQWGVPVAYGPNRGDFEAAQKAAEATGVGFRLENAEQLAQFWINCQNKEARQTIKFSATQLLDAQKAAFERIMEQLLVALPLRAP